jgi:tetratricopeptide (TPR) repeat protein
MSAGAPSNKHVRPQRFQNAGFFDINLRFQRSNKPDKNRDYFLDDAEAQNPQGVIAHYHFSRTGARPLRPVVGVGLPRKSPIRTMAARHAMPFFVSLLCADVMADRDLAQVVALVGQLTPAIQRGDRVQTNAIIAQLVTLRATMGGQWQQLAHIAAGHGELTLARNAMDLNVEAWGGSYPARFQKVGFLVQIGAWREADMLLRSLPDTIPDAATNAYCRGTTALNLGKADDARRDLERAIRLRPQSGHAWFALSMAVNLAHEPALADQLIAAGRGIEQAGASEQAPYHYALGKVHADNGDHGAAFEAFARGARIMKSTIAYDHAADRAEAAKAIDGYSAARINAMAHAQSEPTARTIFVTGLPRSGTTLVEQILTGHSAVSHGGEIARLMLLGAEVGGASYPALARYVEAHGAESAARLWHHWLDELYPASARIIDKTVDTSRFLGLAATLLPDAPLIWMTRDPLDRAWSCFRTNFSGSAIPWSYDLEDIAAHFRLEDQLLARWQQILGDRLLVISYEALVTEPEREIRRVLAHCGLAEEPKAFAPHENARAVTTASMMQVRRPINRDAIGAAEPYRAFLAPFSRAYYR